MSLLVCGISMAQATEEQQDKDEGLPFKTWSVEVMAGQAKAMRPFGDDYNAGNEMFSGVNHFELGVRKMFSERFGLKMDFGYDHFTDEKNSGSLPFDTKQYRLGMQGVINLGRLLKFESFTKNFGILAHGGVQLSQLNVKDPGLNKPDGEYDGGLMLGLTPQYRIGNLLAVTADFTTLYNASQQLNWDGSTTSKGISSYGLMYSASLGLTLYFGGKKEHADWYVEDLSAINTGNDLEARKRLDDIETMLNDADKDGVPDYLDFENNTPSGVAVDTRGKFIDENKNGVPDEMEPRAKKGDPQSSVIRSGTAGEDNNSGVEGSEGAEGGEGSGGSNSRHNSDSYSNSGGSQDVLKSLVENGNVNVFFAVNKDTPNSGSANSVQQLYQYLVKYPKSRIVLYGHADLRGEESKNKDLSKRRALKLKNFFVASGIDPARIEIAGEGVDKTFSTSTKTGLDLARRVSIEIIK